MPNQNKKVPDGNAKSRMDLPSIEDGGIADNTVASPVLGFGMDRIDNLEEPAITDPQPTHAHVQNAAYANTQPQDPPDTLGHNEVAAVDVSDRDYYVGNTPSPYLSSRQAMEDVQVTKRRHSRIVSILVTLFIVGLVGAGGWFVWTSFFRSEAPQDVVQYETSTIKKGEYLESTQSTSLVRPINEANVTSGISGTVVEVLVENGADVEEGQQLFRLENQAITDATNKAKQTLDTFSQEVDKKAAALDKANEELYNAQAAAGGYNTTTNTNTSTNGRTGANSSSSTTSTYDATQSPAVDAAASKVAAAQAEYENARSTQKNMEDTYNHALEQEDALNVYAPVSGTVSELTIQAGESSSVSGSTQLCTISDMSSYRVVLEMPQSQRERIHEGQEVRLTFPAIKDLSVTSTISSIEEAETTDDTDDATESQSFFATVNIENPDEHITTGIAAEATIVLASIPNSYIVPSNTLRTDSNGGTHLDVLLDPTRGIVTDVPVNVVANDGTKAAIEASNIQEGNEVLIAGQKVEKPHEEQNK